MRSAAVAIAANDRAAAMSVTVQQLMSDAKRLASKLKDDDTAADALLSQAQFVYKKIDAMKQVKIISLRLSAIDDRPSVRRDHRHSSCAPSTSATNF